MIKYKKPAPREKDVEKYFTWRVARAGGKAYKWVSPGVRGVPDRIVLINGYAFFVELKAFGGRIRYHQTVIHKELKSHGFQPYTVYGYTGVDTFMDTVHRTVPGTRMTNAEIARAVAPRKL